MTSFDKAIELEMLDMRSKLHFICMWSHVDAGRYEYAMTSQLLFLVSMDELEDFYEKFNKEDWKTSVRLNAIAHGEAR